jgi:type II secretion system protein I
LLEVLVAMVIVGTAVASMMSLLSGSVSNLRRIESASEALLQARSQMNQLLLREQPVVRVQADGRVIAGEKQVGEWNALSRWEATVQPMSETPNAKAVPVRVLLDVWWRREPSSPERHFQLETIQLRRRATAGAGA